ncbi:MAG: ATP-dependent Clp protease ATP-binding subunit [Rhodospirillales bacterium]|nr:ATP-dependent Clp protease ATP-binding subunit [Alphaproteobacteria bacterium]MCB1840038.1 ATP-dependent Clp protease ATP-binding subunit [Alphaproteobacteria bacterium]MCB9977066.1 ATP-dependent Clp protease ATP-binding subunit [Rhodospirillales bacterium]
MTEKWDYIVSEEDLENLIRNYCNDFTALERAGRYPPITGRDGEIDDCILILLQRGRKNCAFLAPAGVGKTAAVVGLAQRVVAETVPDYLKNARVLEVDLARMASGTASRAEFQARLMPFCKGIAERYHDPNRPRYILFIDEIHQMMPNCVGSSYAGMSDTMKPYLTAGDLLVLGATTLDEYRMYVELDPALDRRFQKVFLKIPTVDETYQIMKGLRPSHEKHHKVKISNYMLMLIVKLTDEHMRKRNQPDKSIITMDSAMAYHVREHGVGTELSVESVYHMVGRETKLNKNALHDEKKLEEIYKRVDILEGKIDADEADKDTGPYDPAAKLRDVEMDESYQRQVEKEFAKDKELLNLSLKAQQDKAGTVTTEQKLAELTAKLEKKLEEKVEKSLEEKVGEKIKTKKD